jgi:hypothetical protein
MADPKRGHRPLPAVSLHPLVMSRIVAKHMIGFQLYSRAGDSSLITVAMKRSVIVVR